MKLNKTTAALICELESIIGNECYNPNSHNGWTGEDGSSFRYPVRYVGNDNEEYRTKGKIKDLLPKNISSIYYPFGSNQLYIGEALVKVLGCLEEKYGIDFNKLPKK